MSSWFSKATNVFRREAEETVQPFQVPCVCGQEHQGIRRQRHQHIVCKACGKALFVLPRDVYPPPRETKRNVRDEAGERDDPVHAQDVSKTSGGLETQPVPPSVGRSGAVPTIAEAPPEMEAVEVDQIPVARRQRSTKAKPAPAPPPPVVSRTGVKVREDGKPWLTPTRIVVGGLIGICLLMAFVLFRQQGERSALLTLQTEVDAGRVALAQEEYLDARNHFERQSRPSIP